MGKEASLRHSARLLLLHHHRHQQQQQQYSVSLLWMAMARFRCLFRVVAGWQCTQPCTLTENLVKGPARYFFFPHSLLGSVAAPGFLAGQFITGHTMVKTVKMMKRRKG